MVNLSLDLHEYMAKSAKTSLSILEFLNLSEDLFSFLHELDEHFSFFYINETAYDSVVYTGGNNIYFCSDFNVTTGRVTSEILLILSVLKIDRTSDIN
jgi:hypothetical protein